jgi:hypothetical protein
MMRLREEKLMRLWFQLAYFGFRKKQKLTGTDVHKFSDPARKNLRLLAAPAPGSAKMM